MAGILKHVEVFATPCNRCNPSLCDLELVFFVMDLDKEMLTLPEGRPQQAARFGVQHEEVARKAYIAWRREAMILGTGGSVDVGGCMGLGDVPIHIL